MCSWAGKKKTDATKYGNALRPTFKRTVSIMDRQRSLPVITQPPATIAPSRTISLSTSIREGSAFRSSKQSSVFDPITVSTARSSLRDATSDFTLNKLRFDRLRVHGRRKEMMALEAAVRRVGAEEKTTMRATTTTNNGSFDSADYFDPQNVSEKSECHLESVEEKEGAKAVQQQKYHRKKGTAKHTSKKKELVLLSGYSGTGKSSLITSSTATNSSSSPSTSFISFDYLIKRELGGTLVMGKFDQILGGGTKPRPFTAFRMLCEQLVPHIIAMKTATRPTNWNNPMRGKTELNETNQPSAPPFERFKKQVMTELETELPDLIKTFPALNVISTDLVHDDGISDIGSLIASDRAALGDYTTSERSESLRKHVGTVGAESRKRFNFAFRTLIGILSKYLSPLVMVLDDLQWADAASLDLLEELIADHDNTNAMFICMYRSNEVDEEHLLSKMISKARDRATAGGEDRLTITDIEVGNLDIPAVSEVLQTLLAMDNESRIWELSELCHKKTGGNPFHLIHFVSMLYDVHLLEYNLGLMKWEWDINEIEGATSATLNVVDILKKQMTSLPAENQALLQYASYLGSIFEERLIFVLWRDFLRKTQSDENLQNNRDEHDTSRISEPNEHAGISSSLSDEYVSERLEDAIVRCVEGGYLEFTGEGGYRWVHDKLQEAAMELIPTDTRHEFGQHVAEVLGSQLTDAELEASIFVVVDQFNEGIPPEDPSKRLRLAELNLRAANKAVSYSAFESGVSYCTHGIAMLPADRWEKHYKLSLELYSLGAETEGFMGNHPVVQSYCEEVLNLRRFRETSRSSSLALVGVRDKLRVYKVQLNNVASRGQLQDAVDLCLGVLKQYGVTFPNSKIDMTCRILFNIIRVKATIKSRTEDEVEGLPFMTDPVLVERMGLVDKLIAYSYATRSPLFPLAIFKALHFTLQHGLSKYSPPVFASIGVMLGGVLGDLNGAATYAKYAMMLLAKLDPTSAREVDARTRAIVHNFVLHWTQPARNMLKPLLRGYEVGMLSGDMPSACLSIFAYMLQSLVSGRNLIALEHDCRVYCTQIKAMNVVNLLGTTRTTWQVVLNLIGYDENMTEIVGEALPEDAREQEAETSPLFTTLLNVQESMLCGYFGDHERGAALAMERGNSFQKTNPGSALSTSDVFHRCLSLLAMARKRKEDGDASGLTRQMESKYMKSAKQALSRIKKWVEQDNPNVRHYEALLDAEFAAYGDRPSIAKKFYEAAAYFAGRGGFLNDSALINERYGEYLLYCSRKEKAKGENVAVAGMVDSSDMYEEEALFRLKEAMKHYGEWGASAKVELLEEQYERLFPALPPTEIMLH